MTEDVSESQLPDEPEEDHAPEVLQGLSNRVIAQDRCVRPNGPKDRAQHQKRILSAFGAVRVYEDIPPLAKHGPFAEAGSYKAAIRFSNGQPVSFNDHIPDVRGVAVKFFSKNGETDLLATNEGGRSHAKTASEFVDVADILANLDETFEGDITRLKIAAVEFVKSKTGLTELLREFKNLATEVTRPVKSLVLESYWGSVVKLGDTAIKYSLQPDTRSTVIADAERSSGNYLRADLLERLSTIRFSLCLQFFIDEELTPVQDASVAWKAPLVTIGEVEISKAPTEDEEKIIDSMAFNPKNGFLPLGITHARNAVYAASALHRGAMTSDQAKQYL